MAPRGRPHKKKDKDKRMEAAIQTMQIEYGIMDAKLTMKIVNELLNAYGLEEEDQAWRFIEQYTYQELFEAIVRHNGQENSVSRLQLEMVEDHALENAVEPSCLAAEPICAEVVEDRLMKYKDGTNLLLSTEMDGKCWKDVVCDTEGTSAGDIDFGSMSQAAKLIPTTPLVSSVPSRLGTSPLLSPSSTTANSAPPRRRLPCYGWIENDEEDIDDPIDLIPAKATARRWSRWDMKPVDP